MKKGAIVLVTACLCLFLQSAVFGTFLPRWMIPNLCMVLVVYLGIFEVSPLGAVLSFLVGLFVDFSSGQLIGPWSGAFSAVFGLLSQGGKGLFFDSIPTIILMAFLSSFVGSIVYLFLLYQFKISFSDVFSGVLFGSSFITALLSPLVFRGLHRMLVRKAPGRYQF